MLVVIDGDCCFCQWASRLLKRICQDGFEIIPLSSVSPEIQNTWASDPTWAIDSIKVISNGRLYIKSEAVAQVLIRAKWFAQPLRLLFLLPTGLLDRMYDWVARNRYFWGKGTTCELNSNGNKA
ncbi:thiol-disulfide oxidoreductase DCC family protein [Aquirufa sp. 5-AUSEE-100C1]